ncbi:DNA polymerase III [Escherichia coli]|uniref:DNA polymerase III n=1 Tax=Escherichia coli TaxID=562 RepID=A0A2X1L2C8_ECOLX|nr:DNA polymerase III [Escherichia coli]
MIVPRKGVIELMRMLDGGDNPLRVQIGSNNIRAHVGDFIFTSKLGGWSLPGLSPRSAEEPGQTSGSWLRSAQAGVCSRGDSL